MKIISTIAVALVLLVGAGLLYVLTQAPSSQSLSGESEFAGESYKEIVNPSGFVNTDGRPITIEEFVGEKVILVDFLTYSCINCQRTFPYLNAWYEKYKDQGLQIVGIHTPEFAFEKDIDNVREAMEKFGIEYPIVLDNDYATWRNYENSYWPRKYLINIHGNIVYDHIGEGAYEETEMKIRELLEERAEVLGKEMPMDNALAADSVTGTSLEARSPETYFGASRNEYLTNGVPGRTGEQTFGDPDVSLPNRLYLGGAWNIASEYAESINDSRIIYRYAAKEVYIVAEADSPIEVAVFQDGVPVMVDARGADVDEESTVTIQTSGLYKLINNSEAGEHVLELRVRGTGLRVYTFTFG